MAALLSASNVPPSGIITDSPSISNTVDSFAVDWYPYHNSAITNFPVPVTFHNNMPNTKVIWALTAGHIAKEYLFDFYYRIHLSVYNLQLGNILSDQIFYLNIWNSYFSTQALGSISDLGLSGIAMSLPVAVPHTFQQLEDVNATISVSVTGQAIVNGQFYFNFPGTVVVLNVVGQRVIIWPFAPQNTLTETKEWLTDILSCRSSETRYYLRSIPRSTLSYNYTFREEDEYALAKTIGSQYAQQPLGIPYWKEYLPLYNLSVGQNIITIDTTYYEFAVGSIVVFWKNYNYYDVGEIFSMTSTSITLKKGLNLSFTSCFLMPVKMGFSKTGISLNRDENHKKSANLSFLIVNNITSGSWSTETFLGLPILIPTTISTGGLAENFYRTNDILDSETGNFVIYSKETYNRQRQTIRLLAKSRKELYNLRRQFDYIKGCYQTFWVCSFHTDLGAYTNLTSGSNTLKVYSGYWANVIFSRPNTKYIRIFGDSIANFQVNAVTDNLDGTETLTFSAAAVTTINNISMIAILTKSRLESDTVTFEYQPKDITFVSASVVEIP